MKILDAFSGNLSTWFAKEFAINEVIKNDIRKGQIIFTQGQKVEIIADYNFNMFNDGVIIDGGNYDLIYADPPHLITTSGIMYKKYTDLTAYQLLSVEYDLISLLNNLNDNLAESGVVIIKWNNTDFGLKDLITKSKLFLLFGTTTSKRKETYYYICKKGMSN